MHVARYGKTNAGCHMRNEEINRDNSLIKLAMCWTRGKDGWQ